MRKIDMSTRYADIRTAADVTEEVTGIVLDIADGWYQTGRIDWEDLLTRIDGSELADGSIIDLGDNLISEAIMKIKTLVREHRRDS